MIPKDTDPLVLELQRLASILQIPCTFLFVDLYEGNVETDKITPDQFPVILYFTADKNKEYVKPDNSLTIIREVEVSLAILDRYDAPTQGYKSYDVEPTINRCRRIAENLFWNINNSNTFVGDSGVGEFKTERIDAYNDANLFGVSMEFTMTMQTGISGCYHNG